MRPVEQQQWGCDATDGGQQVKAIQLYDYVHYACTVLQNANVNYQVAMKFDQKAFQDMSNLYM